MKKLLLSILLLGGCFVGFAQQNSYKVYCELHLLRHFNGCEANVDLGLKSSNAFSVYDIIAEDTGEKKIFPSPIAILNYMSKCGWDIEYKVTNADSLDHGSYLLSKFVENDDMITEGLFLVQKKSRNRKEN